MTEVSDRPEAGRKPRARKTDISVQQKERVERLGNDGMRFVVRLIEVIHHVQERLAVGHALWRRDELTTLSDPVGHRGQRNRLADETEDLLVHELESRRRV